VCETSCLPVGCVGKGLEHPTLYFAFAEKTYLAGREGLAAVQIGMSMKIHVRGCWRRFWLVFLFFRDVPRVGLLSQAEP